MNKCDYKLTSIYRHENNFLKKFDSIKADVLSDDTEILINVTREIATFLYVLGWDGYKPIDRMVAENLLPRLLELLHHSELIIVENTLDVLYYMWKGRSDKVAEDIEKFGVFNIAKDYIENHGYRRSCEELLLLHGRKFAKYREIFLNGSLLPFLMRAYRKCDATTDWNSLTVYPVVTVDRVKFNRLKTDLKSSDSSVVMDAICEFRLFCTERGFDNKSPAKHIVENNLVPKFIELIQHEDELTKENAIGIIRLIANEDENCCNILMKCNILNVINNLLSNYSNQSIPTLKCTTSIIDEIIKKDSTHKIAIMESGFLIHLLQIIEADIEKYLDKTCCEMLLVWCDKPPSAEYTKMMLPVVEWMTKTAEFWVEKELLCECLVSLTIPAYQSIQDPLYSTKIIKPLLNELRPSKSNPPDFRKTCWPILRYFRTITSGTDQRRQVFFDSDPWPALGEFARGHSEFIKEFHLYCKLVSNLLAVYDGDLQKVIDSDLVSNIINFCMRGSKRKHRQNIAKILVEVISKSNEQQLRAITSNRVLESLMAILLESNDKLSELILNGLSEVIRIRHDIAEEKGVIHLYLIILKPPMWKKFGQLAKHKNTNIAKMANDIMNKSLIVEKKKKQNITSSDIDILCNPNH